ncbi:putative ribonuclease H-like domain-containing protein [Tanacetum coccineum]
MADEEVPTDIALMAFSDSEVDNEKTCLKTCLKSFETLKTQLGELRIEFNKSEFNLATYKRGLASVEEQLIFYQKNEVIFCEQIDVLKRDISYKDSEISVLKRLFSPPNLDLSNSGLEEFQQPEFEGYGPKTSKSVNEDTSNEVKESSDASLVEELVSNDKLEKKTVFPTVAKINFIRPQQQEKPVRKPVKPKAVNTARPNITVVNAIRPNHVNAIKASACWVWRPTKLNSASITFKRHNYVDAQGRSKHMTGNMSYLSDFKEFDGGYDTFRGGAKGGRITGKGTLKTGKLDFEDVFNWVFFLASKDETIGILKSFITQIENLVDKKVKIIRCDIGTEFKNRVISEFCEKKGIKREFSVARTPHQNGVAERRNRTLIKAARTMYKSKFYSGACQSNKETRSSKDYILMPLWKDGSLFDSSSKNASNDEPQPSSDAGKKDDESEYKESGINDQEKPKNTTHADFFGDEIELDMSNISTTYQVPSTPIIRIYKDHSLDNVNSDVLSSVQTRRMTMTINEHGFISAIYKGKTHEDLHTCLFACFLSQEEPKRIAKALMDLLKGKRVIGNKWIFRNKKDERGIVIRNKLRLVAQGYTQEEGIDYDEVFAHVARIEAIRLFLAYASFMGFMVYQMDVKSAFLYGTIKDEVYVCQPLGFKDPDYPDKVYKVVKALYGLHQASRAWYETLAKYLLDNRFHKGKIDQTLFIKKQKGDILLVQVYVDDIIFSSTKKELCTEFEKLMHDKFQMSSMGELAFFLGLTASTPIDTDKPLLKNLDGDDVNVHLYRSMIGSLMYLTSSRPDIIFVVCACSRFQVLPKASHLPAVKRIFIYLKGQPKLGLWYPRDSSLDLVAYSNSDYIGASLDRKSTTRGCQFLWCRLISWQCKKKTVVATFSTEADYVAAASCYGQKWVKGKEIPLNPNTHPQLLHYLILNQSLFHHYFNPKRLKDLGKPKRATKRSQSSRPIPLVANETIIKEWEDRMERAATTASSLEVEQDSGNINRTQSMATLNESFPQRTGSGSGPRCQDTILGDAEAQIRFEAASK